MSGIIKCFKQIYERTWTLGNVKTECMFTYLLSPKLSKGTKSDKRIKKEIKENIINPKTTEWILPDN